MFRGCGALSRKAAAERVDSLVRPRYVMGAALQSLNERNERWFKIWRNLRGRNSTEDGYIMLHCYMD